MYRNTETKEAVISFRGTEQVRSARTGHGCDLRSRPSVDGCPTRPLQSCRGREEEGQALSGSRPPAGHLLHSAPGALPLPRMRGAWGVASPWHACTWSRPSSHAPRCAAAPSCGPPPPHPLSQVKWKDLLTDLNLVPSSLNSERVEEDHALMRMVKAISPHNDVGACLHACVPACAQCARMGVPGRGGGRGTCSGGRAITRLVGAPSLHDDGSEHAH